MAQTFYKETDGNSVDVSLQYTITGERPILVDNLVGVPFKPGIGADSGDTIAMRSDGAVLQWQAPTALSVSIGDTVYVDTTAVTSAHDVPDAAFNTTGGANNLALFKVLSVKDANDWCDVKLINF